MLALASAKTGETRRCTTPQVFDEWGGYEGAEQHEARAWAEFVSTHGTRFEWIAARCPAEEQDASRALVVL